MLDPFIRRLKPACLVDAPDAGLDLCRLPESGEEIVKTVSAKELFTKIAKMNWDYAEPGILYWDRIKNWNLLSEYDNFEFAGTNPCKKVCKA